MGDGVDLQEHNHNGDIFIGCCVGATRGGAWDGWHLGQAVRLWSVDSLGCLV